MLSLFRSEFYQIRKSLVIKIQFLFIFAISVFLGLREAGTSYANEVKEAGWNELLCGGGSLLSSMKDYSLAILLASLLAAWIISQSFETRTVQEAICYGKSRTKVYLVKMAVYFIVSAVNCLVIWIFGSLFVFMKYGIGTEEVIKNLSRWDYLAGMLIAGSIAYLSIFAICGVIAFITQKTSITIGICIIVVAIGFNILSSVLPEPLANIINYTPAGLCNQVLDIDVTFGDIIKTICISIIWIVLICTAGLWKFRKAELK